MVIGVTGERDGRWSVGELARATGLSVRVLRHWDDIGLVSPARTTGGHRCYSTAEVTRLYQALALRQMGLRLDQVAALLTDADPSPRATLRAHLERVEADWSPVAPCATGWSRSSMLSTRAPPATPSAPTPRSTPPY